MCAFQNIAKESKFVTEEMTAPWTDLTNFGSLANVWQKRSLLLKGEKCSGGKHIEVSLNALAAGNGYSKMILKFLEGSQKIQDVSKALKVCLADIMLSAKAQCIRKFLKNGYGSLLES